MEAEQGWSLVLGVVSSGWCWTRDQTRTEWQVGRHCKYTSNNPDFHHATQLGHQGYPQLSQRYFKTLIPLHSINSNVHTIKTSEFQGSAISEGVKNVWCVRGPCVCMTAASGLTTAVRRAHHDREHNRTRCLSIPIYHAHTYPLKFL